MKLSMIVPVYNTQDYLRECLDSLVHQTWTDIEIICVDDGSTDASAQILGEYGRLDDRIQIIRQENRGLSAARNAGLKAASGEYVGFVDSDDVLEETACERLVQEIWGKEPNLIIFGARTIPEEALSQDRWLSNVLSPTDVMLREGELRRVMMQSAAWPFVWRNCIRRSLLVSEGLLFDEDVRYGEDTLFQMCLLPACRRISFISDRLYAYRKDRPGSLMQQLKQGVDRRASFHVPLVERAAEYWAKKGWMQRWGDVFLGWSLEFAAYDVTLARQDERRDYARRMIRLWQTHGLMKAGRTACAQTFLLMVESQCGHARLRCAVMKTIRNGMLKAISVYRSVRRIS